ncbi:TonB-dependent receptor domain-containing protein [Novosphingobium panipatense]
MSGSPMAFQLTNVSDGTPRNIVVDGQQLVVTQPAPVEQYLQSATFANADCAALAEPRRAYRSKICNDISSYAVDEIWGHNLQVENDFDIFKVKMTSGYRIWHSDSVSDLDGLGAFSGPAFTPTSLLNGLPASVLQGIVPAASIPFISSAAVPTVQQNLFETSNTRRHRQLSQEIEVSGNSDHLDWVVGGFYFWEKGSEYNPQNSGFVLDTNSILSRYGSAVAAANPARYRLVQTLTTLSYTAEAESSALYGQATYYPGGRGSGLRVTAGGRYTWDNKRLFRTQNGAVPFAVPQVGKASYSKFTWNLMLGYDLADGISSYARVATGYRSGGFNASDPVASGTNTIPPSARRT